MTIKNYSQAIQEATDQLLASDDNVIVFGEGVPYGIFGSTAGLKEKYPLRVLDSPISEAAATGAIIGAAVSGMKPIHIHMRNDFSFLAADQLINNAAKWFSTFGKPCNITVRLLIGRAWGNGPTHTQSTQHLFSSISGLKVVMPTSPSQVKGIMISAARDPNPVLILEHRWLYSIEDEVPDEMYETPLDRSQVLRYGDDITVVALSYSNVDALKAIELLKPFNIKPEVIDLISCHHIDLETISKSVCKTGRLLVVETTHPKNSVGAEVVRQVTENYFHVLKVAPKVIGTKEYPCPTSHFLTEDYYTDEYDVANECLRMCNNTTILEKPAGRVHDVPDASFTGPF